MEQGSNQVQGYKDFSNCLIPAATMFGGEEDLWFMETLKRSISKLILSEETWKGIKTVFFKIWLTTCFSGLLNLGAEIMAPNSKLCYEKLLELPPGSILSVIWVKKHFLMINILQCISKWDHWWVLMMSIWGE